MCTHIVSNRKKTIVGWNLDILGMTHRVTASQEGVYIEILDAEHGWLPLFGANNRGDFVGMPTCHPFDARSNPAPGAHSILRVDIDLLLKNRTFAETTALAESEPICSEPGVTFMGALTDRNGSVLQIIPGQGVRYLEKPRHAVLTNFSPFKMDAETHPWMGWDRYQTAERMMAEADDDFDVTDCFAVLRAASQEVCPTVVSMVFDVKENTVHWCENRQWDQICTQQLG